MLLPAGILQKRVQVITIIKLKGGNLNRGEILTKPLLRVLIYRFAGGIAYCTSIRLQQTFKIYSTARASILQPV